jgi:hypothetical protein
MTQEIINKLLSEIEAEKQKEYGPASVGMQKIADVWSILLEKKIRPHQVALLYAAAKLVRANHKYKQDSYLDLMQYGKIAEQIHREDSSELEIK